jgi:hypothetical protein
VLIGQGNFNLNMAMGRLLEKQTRECAQIEKAEASLIFKEQQ